MSSQPDAPRVPYWHLWTDKDGISRQRLCTLSEFELASISPPASPQWLGQKHSAATTLLVTVLPIGWLGTWHENPKPQWIVPLSGRWFVESMDGQRVEMGPGELSFGADQGTREQDGKRGHRSGTLGAAPAVLMLIQLEPASAASTRPQSSAPCPFR